MATASSSSAPAVLEPVRLEIERLGRRGEGVATHEGRKVYVPYALPGEQVLADVDRDRGGLREILASRTDRQLPVCPYFGSCGGCAVQALPHSPYAEWKRGLVVDALRKAGLPVDVEPLIDAHGEGRRRATFHARFGLRGELRLGFMAARSHLIVDIEACPVLSPALSDSLPAARRIATDLSDIGKPLDILVTATNGGLDIDLRGAGPIDEATTQRLVATAADLRLARLSNHGHALIEREPPTVRMGRASLRLQPGAFLQATIRGEEVLAGEVTSAFGRARTVADLFCGVGTFALRLAERAAVSAWDSAPSAIATLGRAARDAAGFRPLKAEVRDLMARPLRADELTDFDALVFDPPRAGADAQAHEIACSTVPLVVAVSCDPGTFGRDLATLVAGGYTVEKVTPVDQFRFSAHVEIVAVLRRPKATLRRRRLLS